VTHLLSKQCMKVLPYVIGCVVLFTIAFAVWVRSLPPPPVRVANTNPLKDFPRSGSGLTFEEALAAQTDPSRKESMKDLLNKMNAEMTEEKLNAGNGEEQEEEPENVMNLDGDEL
jgi:hypothetical protein